MKYNLSKDRYFSLYWVLHSMLRSAFKARTRELAKCGITPEEASVLYILKNINPQATPTEMARWLVRQPNSVSTLLVRMHKKGLIVKTRGLHKKNLTSATITEKGHKAYKASTKRESINQMLSFMSEKEYNSFRNTAEKIWEGALIELGSTRDDKDPITPQIFTDTFG